MEGQLKNLLKHYLVREYKARGSEAMCIKEYLPLCAALLYPYIDSDIKRDTYRPQETIMPIIESIKRHTRNVNNLNLYSLEGLRNYFGNSWLNTIDIDVQKRFLINISLISKMEENGCFSLIDNENILDAYLYGKATYPDVSGNYGCQEYIGEEFIENVEINTDEKHQPPIEIATNFNLDKLREFLRTNFPSSDYPNGLRSYNLAMI